MLDKLFDSSSRAKVLGWLLTYPDEHFFVRQLTKILKLEAGNLSKELAYLFKSGILLRSKTGNQVFYQANSECPIYPELHSMAIKTFGIGDKLAEALNAFVNIIDFAFIFGSFATQSEKVSSDIDLMIIGDITISKVTPELSTIEEQLNREVNPHIYASDEFLTK